MHDPMTVAHEIPSPLPHRERWHERTGKRWGFDVARMTGPGAGRRVYRWWRPKGYTLRLGGRAYGLGRLATIWHVEPKGHDSGDVCRHYIRSTDPQPSALRVRLSPFLKARPGDPSSAGATKPWISNTAWRWHVHHWRIQVHVLGRLRRFLLERCQECGRRYPWGYSPVSHGWDSPRTRWRDGVVRRNYHRECSSLGSYRNTAKTDEEIIRVLVSALRIQTDESEAEVVARLTDSHSQVFTFPQGYRLTRIIGFERDDNYRLKRIESKS